METYVRTAVRWAAYPLLLTLTFGAGVTAIVRGWDYGRVYGIAIFCLVFGLAALEAALPLRDAWRMTWRSFVRDMKYVLAGAVAVGGVNYAFGFIALAVAERQYRGPLAGVSVFVALPVTFLVFEALNYAQHRASHELKGALGRFLWRSHAAHHLPDRVYVFMHAANHPFNAILLRALVMLGPLLLLGASTETILLFNLLNNFSGIISHSNLDLRAGWFNYLLVGPELHRYHHSADMDEAKNFGATLPFYDLLFGTFVYRPGVFPERIGVAAPETYPDSNDFWKVMRLPLG